MRKVENCLTILRPDLLEEWDYEKNFIDPNTISVHSDQKAWWKCEKCGYSWHARISNRSNGTGCPFCAGRIVISGVNDFKTQFPEIAEEWDYEKNIINPSTIAAHTAKKVWWKCPQNHSYLMSVDKRTGSEHLNCPYCSNQRVLSGYNDLLTCFPEIASEWNYSKNLPMTPSETAKKSNKKVWWICNNCKRSYMSTVYNRINGHGCPYCANQKVIRGKNDLLTMFPEVAKEWDYEKNPTKPTDVMSKTHKKVWWRCPEGHSYSASISSRTSKMSGCPICNGLNGTSFQEQAIFYYLSKYVTAINRYVVQNFEIDIYLPEYSIAIEYDGKYYHSSSKAKEREIVKEDQLASLGIELYRIKESNTKDFSNPKRLYYVYDNNNRNLDDVIMQLLVSLKEKIPFLACPDININKDRIEILGSYLKWKKNHSLAAEKPQLLREWNYDKNKSINPESISSGSHHKVWWICKKGHEWQAEIKSRAIQNSGCPYCSNKKVLSGYNDLASTNPDLMKEWDFQKNKIDPSTVTAGVNKKAWWKCRNCGYEWQSSIGSRNQGCGCPICNKKKALSNRKAFHGY